MISTAAYPDSPGLVKFLSFRGITVDKDNPRVIHYFGKSEKELVGIVNSKGPDMVICHGGLDLRKMDFLWASDTLPTGIPVEDAMLKNREVLTNAPDAYGLYCAKLGISRIIVPYRKQSHVKSEGLISRLKARMYWA